MSRYTGPRVKIMRALGAELPGLSHKNIERRPYPPGEHGQDRKKRSEYGLRLIEKQKLRFNYGIGEKQLRRLMIEASRSKTDPGKQLIQLLERRLDNVVFRAGLARTIPAARQVVSHGHLLLNGKRVDIPSYRVRVGDIAVLTDAVLKNPSVVSTLADDAFNRAPWLDVDVKTRQAKVVALPDETTLLFNVDIQKVVEYYSQRV